ncbi:hypothetical protein O181_047211 [Austropuccinia psidii MF-1]|uniref:BURP domain-containing protein n=1 Tax=Austropuccinia psidii MF-1 TaxID=1389203 RepID=A0A9Q3DND8_9BASI|nr:hypothetical protein [Austropuccinia psidii MF-1]
MMAIQQAPPCCILFTLVLIIAFATLGGECAIARAPDALYNTMEATGWLSSMYLPHPSSYQDVHRVGLLSPLPQGAASPLAMTDGTASARKGTGVFIPGISAHELWAKTQKRLPLDTKAQAKISQENTGYGEFRLFGNRETLHAHLSSLEPIDTKPFTFFASSPLNSPLKSHLNYIRPQKITHANKESRIPTPPDGSKALLDKRLHDS